MRSLTLSGTALDLQAADTPFLPGSTAVVTGANGLVIQTSDASAGSYATLATLTTAAPFQTVILNNRWIKVSTSAPATLLGN